MAKAAGHPEGKLSPLPALFPFYFFSSSFLTFGGFLSVFHAQQKVTNGTNWARCCLLERPVTTLLLFGINQKSRLKSKTVVFYL